MHVKDWLFSVWEETARKFNFKKYDTSVVELTKAYTVKNGDDIVKEMILLQNPKYCLRPEITPSLTRVASQLNSRTTVFPAKLYNIGQCWRFETVCKYRKNEHYQFNCDIVELNKTTFNDAEIIALIVQFFKTIKLKPTNVSIRISSRNVVANFLNKCGLEKKEDINFVFNIIDKIKKQPYDLIKNNLLSHITSEQIDELFTIINEKVKILDPELQIVMNYLDQYGIREWVQIDYTIVRGLSYYTGIIFEAFPLNTTINRSICGGGRYDNLMETLGRKMKYTAVGFGLGDVVIVEILRELGLLPVFKLDVDYFIVPLHEKSIALEIASRIRENNVSVEVLEYTSNPDLKKALIRAGKIGAKKVIILFPESGQNIIIKNMETFEQINMLLGDFYMTL
jgi:histidyl-tRNA synthetase